MTPRTAFAVLDSAGVIVAVDRVWRDTGPNGAPFGAGYPVGACYPELCASWGERQALALSTIVRTVLAGECVDGRVAYDYSVNGEDERRRSEMRVVRIDLGGRPHALALHVDLSDGHDLLERYRQARSCVEEERAELTRQATDLIQAREKTVQFVRGKTDFMANLSHEILTPMNGIIGMTDLCLETRLEHDQREYLLAVRSAAHSLLTLFNNILDFSSIESGRLMLAQAEFSLRDVVAETIEPFVLRAREQRLDLRHDLDRDVPDVLIGDPARLSQILHNLIDNAIKFTERGRIRVHATTEQICDRKVFVRFEVADTGIGIDPALHEEIFLSFAQADGSATRERGGAGLGLTIAAQIASSMDSHLHVESRPGEGSTFSLTVPFELGSRRSLRPLLPTDPASPAVTRPEASSGNGESLRILVAEDNPVSQTMARSAVEQRGHSAVLVDNGKDAVHRAVTERFDMVLMDIEMPVLDGFGATALIREHEKGTDHHLPIVALIGHGTPPDRDRFRRAGMDDLLSKPFDASQLEALIDGQHAAALAGTSSFDDERLLRQVGGDTATATELVSMFMQERDTILEPIVRAIERHDGDQLETAALALKGKLGTLAAPRATEAASRLERLGRVGDLDRAEDALTALRAEVGLLQNELQTFLKQRA